MESKIIFLAPCLPNIKGLLVECPIVQYNQKQQQFHHRRASVTIINYRLWVYCLLLISGLNSVKNTNFGLYNKKSFLTHPNILFGVTDHFCIKWTLWKIAFLPKKCKKFPKVTVSKNILCMLPKYIIIHGFRSPLGQKMPWFWPKTVIFHF